MRWYWHAASVVHRGEKDITSFRWESYEVIKLESILSKYKETLSKNPELQNFGDNIYM